MPWEQQDKANLPEWVQAIRDAFSLGVTLYDIQNKERKRAMFNTDVSRCAAAAMPSCCPVVLCQCRTWR